MINIKRLIIYHSADFDGKFSRDIVQKKFDNYCEEIGWNHGDDKVSIDEYNEIYIVDLPLDCVSPYQNNLNKIIWIDHHKSSIEKFKDVRVKGLRKIGKGACELCWEYFFPKDKLPRSIELASRYDVWDLDDDVLNFQLGLRAFENPNAFNLPEGIEEKGKTIRSYLSKYHADYMRKSFYVEFEGYKCICANLGLASSQIFDSIDKSTYDVMITFSYNGKIWSYSIYSTTIDVSEIAVKYGGGGHKGAAGFASEEFILK